jgi:hypothetical protein
VLVLLLLYTSSASLLQWQPTHKAGFRLTHNTHEARDGSLLCCCAALLLAGPPSTALTRSLRHPVWPVGSLLGSLGLLHRAAVDTPIQTAACPSLERSTLLQPTPTKTTRAAVGAAMRCEVAQSMAVLLAYYAVLLLVLQTLHLWALQQSMGQSHAVLQV